MKYVKLQILAVLAFLIIACEPQNKSDYTITYDKVSGYIQKGPFNPNYRKILAQPEELSPPRLLITRVPLKFIILNWHHNMLN